MMDTLASTLVLDTVADIASNRDGASLIIELDAFGWRELLDTEPDLAITAVFQGQGRAGTWSAALHDVLGVRLRCAPSTTCLVPRPGASTAGRVDGAGLRIDGLVLGGRPKPRMLVASVTDPDGVLSIVGVEPDEMSYTPISGLDPGLQIAKVTGFAGGPVFLADGDFATHTWHSAVAAGRVALAHYMVGAMWSMQTRALRHATERSQFGQPISNFQAIRHRLSEVLVSVSAAEAAAREVGALITSERPQPDIELGAAVTKLIAGRSALAVAAHCQQILAGIGFTADHDFHRFMKRVVVLDRLLGSGHELALETGRELRSRQVAPRLIDL